MIVQLQKKNNNLQLDNIHQQNKMIMKSVNNVYCLFCVIFCLCTFNLNAQTYSDSSLVNIEYIVLEEALKSPEKVYRLNLSNTNFKMPSDSVWSRFINLEFLSLKNDHLKEIPGGIGNLKNLKTLDLSGNDFRVLPQSFSSLTNLKEIYLNNEVNMNVDKTLMVLKDLPNLQILHLENDNLKRFPKSLLNFNRLEELYLNNNRFKKIPKELKQIKSLHYVDLHDNKINLDIKGIDTQGFGLTMRF